MSSSPFDRARALLRLATTAARGLRDAELSYSQDGEDRILAHMFRDTQVGYYVDVGAHDPRRFSNTFLFYRRGWRGLNIDPRPGTRSRFERDRPRDVTLECGVGSEPGALSYHIYDEPAYNTFNLASAELMERRGFPRRLETRRVPVERLDALLARHLPAGQAIDFLTVDAEGFDLAVLSSNDWTRFRPRAVVAEDGVDVASSLRSPIGALLAAQRYTLVSRTNQSVVWVDQDWRRTAS